MKTIDKILNWLIYAGLVLITMFYFLLADHNNGLKYIFTGILIVIALFIFASMEEES